MLVVAPGEEEEKKEFVKARFKKPPTAYRARLSIKYVQLIADSNFSFFGSVKRLAALLAALKNPLSNH
jgi:hypothetical protein